MQVTARNWKRLIENWQPENFSAVNELLAQYETFEPSLEVIAKLFGTGAAGVENFAGIGRTRGTFRIWRIFWRNKPALWLFVLDDHDYGRTSRTHGIGITRTGSTECELVRRAREGDLQAYDDLVKRYQERIYATIYHMTSNHEDANDLAQDSFIKAFQALKSFKGGSSFYTWLYRIAVNKTINFLKQRKNRHAHEPERLGFQCRA